jgi:hypothetical protein
MLAHPHDHVQGMEHRCGGVSPATRHDCSHGFMSGEVFVERRVVKSMTRAPTPPYAEARRPGEGCYASYPRISASSVVPVARRSGDRWAPERSEMTGLFRGHE